MFRDLEDHSGERASPPPSMGTQSVA